MCLFPTSGPLSVAILLDKELTEHYLVFGMGLKTGSPVFDHKFHSFLWATVAGDDG